MGELCWMIAHVSLASTWCTVLPGHLKNMRLDGSVVVDDCPCLPNLYGVAHSLQQVQSHSMIWKNIIQVLTNAFHFIKICRDILYIKVVPPEKNDIKEVWLVKFLLVNRPSHIITLFLLNQSYCHILKNNSRRLKESLV
jgi:hypothetical protein